MSTHSTRSLTILAVASIGIFANASPRLFSRCGVDIKNPNNGTGVHFDESCQTAYVLPPAIGKAELKALAPNQNLQFCSAVKRAGNIARENFESMEVVAGRIKQMLKDYEPLENRINDVRVEKAKVDAAYAQAKKAMSLSEEELAQLETNKKRAELDLQDCIDKSGIEACASQKEAATQASQQYQTYRQGEYRENRRTLERAELEATALDNKLIAMLKRYTDSVQPLIDLQKSIGDLNQQALSLYRDYAGLEGATGSITYSLEWSKLVAEYQSLNEGQHVAFTPIPVKEGVIWASLKTGGMGVATEIPALLRSNIAGFLPSGQQGIGNGSTVPVTPEQFSAPNDRLMNTVMNSLGGQVVLSLVGACPFFDGPTSPVRDVNYDQLLTYVVPNATFTFELAASRGYTARYNLSQLMSRFEKYTQKGGFFSTTNIHTVIEDNHSDDWFEIKFDAESSEFQYTAEEQNDLKKTVKAELMDQALKRVATFNAGSAPALPPLGGQSGASAISGALRYCPMWYCQAGSLVFGVLDSIFGSKSAVSDFKRNNNVWVTDTVRGVRIVDRSQTITFGPENPALPGRRE